MKEDVRILVMDVDGTLTDGKIYMSASGELFKAFDVKDGCGIKDILPKYNISPVVITARESEILANRCAELGIKELHQGVRQKFDKLQEVMSRLSSENNTMLTLSNVAYIGDDILDLLCINPINEAGGITGCPANAVEEVSSVCSFVSTKDGGNGAVRDFITWLTTVE